MITAHFNDSFPPIADGVALGVKNYALWMNRKYGKAYVMVPEFPGYTDEEEFEVIRFKSVPLLFHKPYRIGLPNISFEARKRIMELPIDIIHARSPFASGFFAQQIAAEKKIPLIASFHSQYYFDIKAAVKSERLTIKLLDIIVKFYEKADVVWTVNEITAQTLKSYGYSGDIDIIENGIDFKIPDNYDEIRAKAGAKLKIGKNEFVMLYVGQMVWHKNLNMIAEGLAEVKKAGLRFKMIFVGEGDAEPELKKIVEDLGIKDNTIFLGKVTDRNDILSIYARGDLFLFPSVYDTFGIVVREAAELLCPCLLVEGTNAAHCITDLKNGFLCDNSVESFSSAIVKIISNPQMLKKAAEGAKAELPKSWESIVDKAYLKYTDIIRSFHNK